jgi:hypothetical protein
MDWRLGWLRPASKSGSAARCHEPCRFRPGRSVALIVMAGEGPIGVKITGRGMVQPFVSWSSPASSRGSARPPTSCSAHQAKSRMTRSFMARGWAAALAAIFPANWPRKPASMARTRSIRHSRCIAARVSPFVCRAGVRPGILYTEDARGPRSATEKASMSPAKAPRAIVNSRWRSHQRILSGPQWSSDCLRAKIEERISEPRDLHAPSCRGNHATATTRTTQPIPVITRQQFSL